MEGIPSDLYFPEEPLDPEKEEALRMAKKYETSPAERERPIDSSPVPIQNGDIPHEEETDSQRKLRDSLEERLK